MKNDIIFIFLIISVLTARVIYITIKAEKEGQKIDAENAALIQKIRLKFDSIKQDMIDFELLKMELEADTILMNLRKFNKEIDSLNKKIDKWQ